MLSCSCVAHDVFCILCDLWSEKHFEKVVCSVIVPAMACVLSLFGTKCSVREYQLLVLPYYQSCIFIYDDASIILSHLDWCYDTLASMSNAVINAACCSVFKQKLPYGIMVDARPSSNRNQNVLNINWIAVAVPGFDLRGGGCAGCEPPCIR